MRYAILMSHNDADWTALSDAEQQACFDGHRKLEADLKAAGKFVDVLHFHPRSEAVTLRRSKAGRIQKRSGTFIRGDTILGGLYVIEADSLEEAAKWGRQARFMVGANEVREIW